MYVRCVHAKRVVNVLHGARFFATFVGHFSCFGWLRLDWKNNSISRYNNRSVRWFLTVSKNSPGRLLRKLIVSLSKKPDICYLRIVRTWPILNTVPRPDNYKNDKYFPPHYCATDKLWIKGYRSFPDRDPSSLPKNHRGPRGNTFTR